MIIVNLKGGMGNQLFQYALGRHLSLLNETELKLDIDGLARANITGDIYRPFEIDAFNIKNTIATASEVRRLKYPFGLLSKALRWLKFKLSKDKNTVFNPKVFSWGDDIFLDGYWQSPKFFESIRDVLISELTLKSEMSTAATDFARQIQETEAVSIHIRRGDYIKNPRVQTEFGVCTTNYYLSAVDYLNQHTSSPTYFVFSDDIDWVKENLPLPKTTIFVKGKEVTTVEELVLMSMCKHNIIANSTFSWWGAWLNTNLNKIVVTPTPWWDKRTYDKNLILESWIKLPK